MMSSLKPSNIYCLHTKRLLINTGDGYHLDKLDVWKRSLFVVSDKVADVLTSQQCDVNELCEQLVSRVKNQLAERDVRSELAEPEVEKRNIPLEVGRDKLGLDGLVQDFEMHCKKSDPERGKIIGIWGIGGSGKTTLAKELFNRKCSEYTESSFLFNVREASPTSLQSKLFRDLFHTHNALEDAEKGIILLKSKLKSFSRFLVVVDDVTSPEQINALVPLYTINTDNLVIVTACDEKVLEEADISVRYKIREMDPENGQRLFRCHAFQLEPPSGYEVSVERFVGKCGGLPLSLQLLGGYALCTKKDTWEQKLDEIPETLDIQSILKLSYEALEKEQKNMFIDIACFFIEKEVEMAKRIWKASGWETENALKTLRDRCLVDVVREDLDKVPPTYVFRMHEELRTFGRDRANSGEIKRVWCLPHQILESNSFQYILKEAEEDSFRCLNSISDMCITYFLGHSNSEKYATLQWLELNCKCIPQYIRLEYLEALRVVLGVPKRLWESDVKAPCELKELLCQFTIHDYTQRRAFPENLSKYSTSLRKLSRLECLMLKFESSDKNGKDVVITWDSFLKILLELSCLKTLHLLGLKVDGKIGLSYVRGPTTHKFPRNLESLTLSKLAYTTEVSISGDYCPALKCLKIEEMKDLIKLHLKEVKTLKRLEVFKCHQLKRVLGKDLPKLEILSVEACSDIEELPDLESLSCLERIRIMACEILQSIEGIKCLSSLEDITVTCCPKLQKLEGIEKLERLKSVILSDGSMGKCVSTFQKLPSKFTLVMGRASTASWTEDQIRKVVSTADSWHDFNSRKEGYQKLQLLQKPQQSFSTIILLAKVVSDLPIYMDRLPEFGETIRLCWETDEKLIYSYTIVVTDPDEIAMVSHSIPGYCWMPTFHLKKRGKCLQPVADIKKGYVLGMKKGRHDSETLLILKELIGQLYN
ncbi:disease resistance protein RUN1 [Cryptomeria japonica]|uniref:disease resistance protein RUN1 n=1 Tax=Cryptomeria japonica TaxID=3369 RepID=UPI0027DA90AE|nr:disease resistance protein RUN1 [Cryptomeria japonica]